MVSVVASAASAVKPNVDEWFGIGYNRYAPEWAEIFESENSKRNFEEEINYYGTNLFQLKPETAQIKYDDMGQGWPYYYRHSVYALGYAISKEAVEDNLYVELATARAQALGISANQTMENLGAAIINQGYSTLYADGQPLFSTSNKLAKGGTFANSQTGAQLSEASIENLIILIGQCVDDAGNKIKLMGRKLFVPLELEFDAERILGNKEWRPATTDRDINALANKGMLPDGYSINHYFSDNNFYMIKTDLMLGGAKRKLRRDVAMYNETPDFDTDVMKFKCDFRVVFGCADKRQFFANPGA